MDTKHIKECRICKSDKLAQAFGIDNDRYYVVCKICTTLQRREDILYQIDFNFEGRRFEVDYYPAFLKSHDTTPMTKDKVFFFSLTSIEYILSQCGYDITEVVLDGYTLHVVFDKVSLLKRIQRAEKRMRLDNQYTFMLWAMQLKK